MQHEDHFPMTPAHELNAHAHVHPQHGAHFDGTMTPMNIYGTIGLLAILVYLYWTIFLKDGPTKKYNRRGDSQDESEVNLKAFNKK